MKCQRIVAALAAASLAFGGTAFAQSTGAQDQGWRHNGTPRPTQQELRQQRQIGAPDTDASRQRDGDRRRQDFDRNTYRGDRGDRGGRGGRGDYGDRGHRGDHGDYGDRGDHREYQRRGRPDWRPDRRDGWGAGPDHSFYRGDRLPPRYRSYQYVVDDWRGHRLSAPPRGYHWVQTGGDYVLAAIATGVILSVLLSH